MLNTSAVDAKPVCVSVYVYVQMCVYVVEYVVQRKSNHIADVHPPHCRSPITRSY